MMITNREQPDKHPRPHVFLNAGRVHVYLLHKCKSQGWLGYRLGITRTYMSQLMTAHRSPSAKLRRKILSKLGGTFEDWFEIAYPVDEHPCASAASATGCPDSPLINSNEHGVQIESRSGAH